MRTIIGVCSVLALLGCHTAPTAPTAEDYKIRHHVADAVNLLFKYRVWQAEHVMRKLALATSNRELRMPEPTAFATSSIKSLEVLPDGSLMATMQPASGYKDATIRFIPDISNVNVGIQWACVSHEITDIATWLSNCNYRPR